MMDDEDGEMHLKNLKLYEATTEEDTLTLLFLTPTHIHTHTYTYTHTHNRS
jgi:hypothetical protein